MGAAIQAAILMGLISQEGGAANSEDWDAEAWPDDFQEKDIFKTVTMNEIT